MYFLKIIIIIFKTFIFFLCFCGCKASKNMRKGM